MAQKALTVGPAVVPLAPRRYTLIALALNQQTSKSIISKSIISEKKSAPRGLSYLLLCCFSLC